MKSSVTTAVAIVLAIAAPVQAQQQLPTQEELAERHARLNLNAAPIATEPPPQTAATPAKASGPGLASDQSASTPPVHPVATRPRARQPE